MITVTPLPAFTDNYLWLLHRDGADPGDAAVVVDPGDGQVVLAALRQRGLRLAAVLVTHHHPDHVGGLPALRQAGVLDGGIPVYGPRAEAGKIAGLTHLLDDGDRVALPGLDLSWEVMAVPGHTLGHIAYFEAAAKLLFCGDTLFVGGCGRLFEGTAQQMYDSLQRLSRLPGDTAVYCAHEYTLSNLDFARAAEPGNKELEEEIKRVQALRAGGRPTVPSSMMRELVFNPFLRCGVAALARSCAAHAVAELPGEVAVFAELRSWKDSYKSNLR